MGLDDVSAFQAAPVRVRLRAGVRNRG